MLDNIENMTPFVGLSKFLSSFLSPLCQLWHAEPCLQEVSSLVNRLHCQEVSNFSCQSFYQNAAYPEVGQTGVPRVGPHKISDGFP